MSLIRRTARAEDDLVEVWIHVVHDNPDAADQLLSEIDCKCVTMTV